MSYPLIEMFTSIDGEGPSAGELATFIRFAGCDLRCTWCDTAYSWNGEVKPDLTAEDEIVKFVEAAGAHNVTITGGEPLIQKNIDQLIGRLAQNKKRTIRIETHGGVNIKPYKEKFKDEKVQFVVDFKLPGSGMMDRMHLPNLDAVDKSDTYKFVIASTEDLNTTLRIVRDHDLISKTQVYFSPVVGSIQPKEIVEKMIEEKINGPRIQLQLHKYIWPRDMRGV